jgi:hypothetical protein
VGVAGSLKDGLTEGVAVGLEVVGRCVDVGGVDY